MTAGAEPMPAVVRAGRQLDPATLDRVAVTWRARWPEALALWSRYTRLSEPRWCRTAADEAREELEGSFAMIRHRDKAIVVSLRQVVERGLDRFALEILGHEIGHFVFAPADLTDHGRLLARIRAGLPGREELAPFVANLYTDLLINDRLHRRHGLDVAGVYRALGLGGAGMPGAEEHGDGLPGAEEPSPLWDLYLRIYEVLWSLPSGELVGHRLDQRVDADALLGARLVRAFAQDWLDGAGRFAALVFAYLDPPTEERAIGSATRRFAPLADLRRAGAGGVPAGLTDADPAEAAGAIHPALDPRLNGLDDGGEPPRPPEPSADAEPAEAGRNAPAGGQARAPWSYGELLRALGLELSDHDVAVRYYRERAQRHLVPYPRLHAPAASDPHPEGTEPWDVGSPLADIDWVATALRSPVVIPGVTTEQRVWGASPGREPATQPVDLDLYVDSSGSMPDPRYQLSYLTLAGAIVALSALRSGASVQATLWSGPGQVISTGGFVRDEDAVLRVITDFFGGSTSFPVPWLARTYVRRGPDDPPVHILHISDDGIDTLFAPGAVSDAGTGADPGSGADVAALALARARGGGTMVLNLWRPADEIPALAPALAQGWDVHRVSEWSELEAFARAFARRVWRDTEAVSA